MFIHNFQVHCPKIRSVIHILAGVIRGFSITMFIFNKMAHNGFHFIRRSTDVIYIQVKIHTEGGLCVSLLIIN